MLKTLIETVARAARIHRGRQALLSLSDAQLQDIGMTRDEAEREARRPFWDAPTHWKTGKTFAGVARPMEQ